MTVLNKLSSVDPSEMPLVIDGKTVSGYAAGVQVSIVWDADAWVHERGNDGEDTRFATNNFAAVLTITLAQSSDFNKTLSNLINEDLSTGQRIFVSSFKDLNGQTQLSSAKCFILKYADVSVGNTGQNRVWRIKCTNLRGDIGGNTAQ